MTSTRVFNQAGGALALTLLSLVGCNAIVGLDKIQVSDNPSNSGGSNSSGGQPNSAGGSAGKEVASPEGGTGATHEDQAGEGGMGGEVDPGDCKTNQECTDRFTNEAMGE